jgi:glycosyltransferase involved in cell wall biosynthesis
MISPEKLADNIWFHCLHVPKTGWLRTFYQGCIRATRKKLREIQPDLVHGQGTERDCSLCAVLSGFPNVITIHGNMAELARLPGASLGAFGWLAARLENFTLHRTGGVFCNSEYTERLVKPRTWRTWRVPNAIREPFFAPRPAGRRSSRCVLVNVGVICPRKRQVELLQAARSWREQGLDFELQFVGSADPQTAYAADFLKQIKPLEQAGCARHLGLKSTAELIECFDQASALVHFPLEESFGLVVAEALARGLKLFGARVGGIRDIACEVPGAELLAVDDWNGLNHAVSRWIKEGFPLPANAKTIIAARYHPECVAQRHLEIYREVLHKVS